MKLTSFTISILAAVLLAACGSKSTIDLQKQPEAPVTQTPPNGKPGAPANPDDPTQNPEKPEVPDPTVPQVPRYRVVCELGTGSGQRASIATAETGTRSIDPVFDLYLGKPKDPKQNVTRANYNIPAALNAIPVPGAAANFVDLLFTGVVSTDIYNTRLFFASADTVYRLGKAVDLGPAVVTSVETRKSANDAGLSPANYGASDAGRFLILPSSGSFKIVTRDQSRTVGTISADTSSTILPKIYEKLGLYVALAYNGHGFSPVVRKLSISSSSVSVVRSIDVGSVNSSAASIQPLDSGKLIWAEEKVTGEASMSLAVLDVSSGRVTRTTYRTRLPGARVFPQIAVTRDDSGSVINVAIESLTYDRATNTGAHVAYAKVQPLTFDGSSLKEGLAIDYPIFSVAQVEKSGLKGAWIIGSLLSNDIADRLVATFESRNGQQAFIVRGGTFDGIGSSVCLHAQLTEAVR